ncbi:MAG: PrsW family intramembrane metalloprotease [Pseudonocardia sp.]|nr:PrsW family intramembrane metalloprotease [Pseudonocardia sp.]
MSVNVSAPAITAAGATGWRRHAWIGVLAVGLALFLAVERTLVATQNPNMIPTTILLGAAVVPAAFVAFISGRRLRYAVTGTVVAATAFFGGVIGLVVAGTLEFDAQHDLGGLPMIGVGLIEETSKLIVPLTILLFLRRYRTPADGLLIGVASGAGFAAMETMGYAFTTLIASRGSITDTVDELLLRGLLSPAGHMAWTGIAAAALYAAAASSQRGRKVGEFVVAFLIAVGLHALWDSQHSLLGMAVVGTVSLALLAFAAHRCAVQVQQRRVPVAATEPLPRPDRRA